MCNPKFSLDNISAVCTTKLNHPRKILVAAMLSYEVDTLQIALAEYDGLADVLLSENLNLHNPRQTTPKPFYVWPKIRDTPGFANYKSAIFWQGCTNKRKSLGTYEAEDLDEWCEAKKVKTLTEIHGYDVIITGSIDEVLSRRELIRLKWCKDIPHLPTKGAIGMPMGLLGRSFRTDHPPRGMPWALSMPNVYGNQEALDGRAKRNVGKDRDRNPLVGGMHLTNYCFIPAMILKEMWNADYGHNLNSVNPWQSVDDVKQRCYNNFNARIKQGTGSETVVPRLLRECPSGFPAWYGRVDEREKHFHKFLLSQAHK